MPSEVAKIEISDLNFLVVPSTGEVEISIVHNEFGNELSRIQSCFRISPASARRAALLLIMKADEAEDAFMISSFSSSSTSIP